MLDIELPPLLARLTVATLLSMACTSWSQTTPDISEADMERTRRETPTLSDADMRQILERQSAVPAIPAQAPGPSVRIDALPQPASTAVPDLAAIAKGFSGGFAAQDGADTAQLLLHGPRLLVFVSLAMPEPSLQRILQQAAQAHASVLIRGLHKNSLRKTAQRIQQLGNVQGSTTALPSNGVLIDPQAFDRFAIRTVPTTILARDGTQTSPCSSESCPPAQDFVQVRGDVSLDYALAHLKNSAPEWQREIDVFLNRLPRQARP